MNIEKCEEALSRLSDLLLKFDPVINVCMVDFIIKDIFSTSLDEELALELLTLTEQEITRLPLRACGGKPDPSTRLGEVINDILAASPEAQDLLTAKEALLPGNVNRDSVLRHFDRIMGEKKTHEVVEFGEFIAEFVGLRDGGGHNQTLVDLGSGKGYLSQIMATFFPCDVLAIDAKSTNTKGAEKRAKNLESKWEALFRRAAVRSRGEIPPTRGKNWKAKWKTGEDEEETRDFKHRGRLETLTRFVDVDCNLNELIEASDLTNKDNNDGRFSIIGLHTCGNLAPHSMRLFLTNDSAKYLLNVGCCYHLLDEEFYRNPFSTEAENDEGNKSASFPLSKFLKGKKFALGRNARMLAAQSLERMAEQTQLPSKSLLWRAALQRLILQSEPNISFGRQQVGRIAAKAGDFVDYCKKAFEKIGLEAKLTDEDIESFGIEMEAEFGRKLNAFYQFRSLFANCVENLILIDRLLFLREQENVSEAHLIRMFDPVVSPRCFAVLAVKNV